MDKKRKAKRIYILLGIYCILLVWITLFKLSFSVTELEAILGTRSINLIPFYYKETVGFHFEEVMNNFIIFIPFGLYLKMIDIDNKKAVIHGLLFSILLELCQFIFKMGASDITDILTNTLGTATGVLLYLLLVKVIKNREKLDKILGILASIATFAFVGLIFLLVAVN